MALAILQHGPLPPAWSPALTIVAGVVGVSVAAASAGAVFANGRIAAIFRSAWFARVVIIVSFAALLAGVLRTGHPDVAAYVASLPSATLIGPRESAPQGQSATLRVAFHQEISDCYVEVYTTPFATPLLRRVAPPPPPPLTNFASYHSPPYGPCRVPHAFRDALNDRWFLVFDSSGFQTPAAVTMLSGVTFLPETPTPALLAASLAPPRALLVEAAVGLVIGLALLVASRLRRNEELVTLALILATLSVAPLLGTEFGMLLSRG
jgi:hypothetical protein